MHAQHRAPRLDRRSEWAAGFCVLLGILVAACSTSVAPQDPTSTPAVVAVSTPQVSPSALAVEKAPLAPPELDMGSPLRAGYRLVGSWKVSWQQSVGQTAEVYKLTPKCKKGSCDSTATVMGNDGKTRKLGIFKFKDGRYTLVSTKKKDATCLTAAGVEEPATARTVTKLVVATYRQPGTAVDRAVMIGQRSTTVERANGLACDAGPKVLGARGEPVAAAAAPCATPRPKSGWTRAAYKTSIAYTDSTWLAYTERIPAARWNSGAKLFGATCDLPTPEQRGTCWDAEVKSIYQPIQKAVRSHFAFMKSHPAARCFADAYTADRAVGNAYLTAARNLAIVLNPKNDAAYYAALDAWDKWIAIADKRSTSFLKKFHGYFSDCR